jgi:hypothetical protein
MLQQAPADALALFLAGVALFQADTPESIRLLEGAEAKAADFPWSSLHLAEIYSGGERAGGERAGGERADKKKAAEHLAAFFAACPGSTDHWAIGS